MVAKIESEAWHIPHQYGRGPLDDDELWEYIYTMWGVKLPRRAICKGHTSPFQAVADAFFARSPVTVWKASRGFGGKTHSLGILSLTESVALGAQVTVLGGSASQSLRVHEIIQEATFSDRAPDNLLSREPTKYESHFTTGGWIRALMASQRSVRGPHPQRLRLDEIDEMELEILEAAQGQPMSLNGIDTQTVMSSTHQYGDGTMTEILARADEKGWKVYEWCFEETSAAPDGWLSKHDISRKKQEVTKAMWEMEYELQEPSFEGRAIDLRSVEKAFDPEIGEYEGKPGEVIIIEEPQPKALYATGADWAKEKDWTVIRTFRVDVYPWREVAFERIGRMPWGQMISRLDKRIDKYGGVAAHDATGLGNVVADILEHDVFGIVMAGRRRDAMLNEYVAAIEEGAIRSPRIMYAYKEHRYALLKDLYGTGHTPDSLVAGAMAWAIREEAMRGSPPPVVSLTRDDSPWAMEDTAMAGGWGID